MGTLSYSLDLSDDDKDDDELKLIEIGEEYHDEGKVSIFAKHIE